MPALVLLGTALVMTGCAKQYSNPWERPVRQETAKLPPGQLASAPHWQESRIEDARPLLTPLEKTVQSDGPEEDRAAEPDQTRGLSGQEERTEYRPDYATDPGTDEIGGSISPAEENRIAHGEGEDRAAPGNKPDGEHDFFTRISSQVPWWRQQPAPVPSRQVQPQSIKVALLVPLSGRGSEVGQALLNSAQMALFDMNFGSFELMPRDTKGTASGARQAARSAIDDGARLILGPLFAHSVRAAGDVADDYDIHVIGFSTDWGVAGDNVFTMGFMPFAQVRRVTSYAAEKGHYDVGIIAPDNKYGQAVMDSYLSQAAKYQLNTVDILRYSTMEGNISPRVRKFTQYDERKSYDEPQNPDREDDAQAGIDKPDSGTGMDAKDQDDGKEEEEETIAPSPFDSVLMAVGGEQALALANLLSFYDVGPQETRRLGTGLWDDQGLAQEPNLQGAWFAAPSPRLRQPFEKRYEQIYGDRAPRLASLAYDATALALVLARSGMQQAGRPDFSRRALTNPNGYAGIDGIFRFREDGLVERGLAILTFEDGQITTLEPAPTTFQLQRQRSYNRSRNRSYESQRRRPGNSNTGSQAGSQRGTPSQESEGAPYRRRFDGREPDPPEMRY